MKATNSTSLRIHKNTITKILTPLKNLFDIDYFTYCIYRKDECEFISSDYNELHAFLNDEESNMPADIAGNNHILSWDKFTSEKHLKDTVTIYHYNPNGVTIVLKHDNHNAEHISLCTLSKNTDLMETINKKSKAVQEIITHVRNYAHFQKTRLLTYKKKRKQVTKNEPFSAKSESNNVIPLAKREFVFGINGPTYITPAEKRCLGLLMKLQTSKEIAKSTNNSERTVEHHLANIKKKLGV